MAGGNGSQLLPMPPSKKSKGRLKKLLKKVYGADPSRDVSGLVEAADWVELQQLLMVQQSQNDGASERSFIRVGPRIAWRQPQSQQQQSASAAVVDAADHRDLLFRLVGIAANNSDSSAGGGGGGGKKRRLDGATDPANSGSSASAPLTTRHDDDDYVPKVPPFASVHNPALFERAAVLEFRCTADQYQALVEEFRAVEGSCASGKDDAAAKDESGVPDHEGNGNGPKASNSSNYGACLAVPTRWFPGLHHPKPPSHGLLYATPHARKVPKPSHPAAPRNLSELAAALVDLAPSREEMRSEGYPCLTSELSATTAAPTLSARLPERQQEECKSGDDDDDDDEFLLSFENIEAANDVVRRCAVTISNSSTTTTTTTTNGHSQNVPYVATVDLGADSDGEGAGATPRVCAIDCEMVETTLGRELARITLLELVEFDGSVPSNLKEVTRLRMDQLVQPRGAVTDYLTQYSGITAQLLASGPTVDLVQVQAALLQFLSRNDVLIGHSLENDLHALRLVHPTVLDTALLFRAQGATYKHSLRHLTSNLLQRTIQTGSHCSREDAKAALDLAVQRAYKGPNYARHLIRPRPVNLLTRLSQRSTLVCLGTSEWLQEHVESRSTIHALSCESVRHPNRKAMAAWLASPNPARRARLAYGCWTLPAEKDNDNPEGDGDGDAIANGSAVGEALALVRTLRSQLPPSAVVCVALQAEFLRALQLTEQRKARLNPKSTVRWTEDEEVEWARLVNHARTGMVYWMTGTKEEQESDPAIG
jgi:DNA polymerase III epsilon subunit-like protein